MYKDNSLLFVLTGPDESKYKEKLISSSLRRPVSPLYCPEDVRLQMAVKTSLLCAPQTSRATYGSRVAAVLVPCLIAVAIALVLSVLMGVAKLREKRRTEGGYRPPSKQEKEGSRVEMWSITQPPPMERLI
uniref:Crumbs homolog 3b n=1 Tax=Periophthalmus magnuspinnatus TaxID=409849 RepID=A0A3B3ZAZ1_9GOBI